MEILLTAYFNNSINNFTAIILQLQRAVPLLAMETKLLTWQVRMGDMISKCR